MKAQSGYSATFVGAYVVSHDSLGLVAHPRSRRPVNKMPVSPPLPEWREAGQGRVKAPRDARDPKVVGGFSIPITTARTRLATHRCCSDNKAKSDPEDRLCLKVDLTASASYPSTWHVFRDEWLQLRHDAGLSPDSSSGYVDFSVFLT